MYLLLRRISKLSARRDDSRFFSTLPLSPYLKLSDDRMLRESPEGYVVDQTFFDPKTATEECISEKTVPISRQYLMGASKGWLVGLKDEDCKVCISDLYKPWVSSPRVISLPSILKSDGDSFYPGAASISSSDPNLGDNFYVAAAFRRDTLSLLRSTESSWTHVESKHLQDSTITYSKRDKVFYFTSKNGIYLGILDLIHREIKYHFICLRDLPTLSGARWSYLNRKCMLTNHVVEAPSGELFFIMWYTQCRMYQRDEDRLDWENATFRIERIKPKRFLVFREDEKTKEFWYTENIGDLCIFLGSSEAFCVSASMYPGLIPNSIYYVRGPGLGCYSLAFDKARALSKIDGNYWIEPVA